MRSVVFPIIGINVLIYIIQIMWDPFTALFVLDQSKVLMEPYRILTSMFMHGSTSHIAFNMFGLLIFGPILEQIIGSRRFLYTYIGSGLFAGIVAAAIYPTALGASGAIFGMLGVLIMLLPNLKILLFFVIPMPLWMAGILWVGLDIFGLFNPGSVANAAHLAGIAAGFGYGYYLKNPKLRPRKKKPLTRTMTSNIELSEEDIENFKNTGRI